jgi:hypothetical protein
MTAGTNGEKVDLVGLRLEAERRLKATISE